MSLIEHAPAHIRAIAPYQPGKPISELAREMGLDESDIIKLASNENPLGASPRALAAIENVLMEVARYPDGNGYDLKTALSERMGVTREQIVLGNGSNDVLEMAARAFLAPGVSAVYSQYAFAVYPIAVQATGARGIEVPARDWGHDLPAMLKAIEPDTRLVFIANPNNPTGTLASPAEMTEFLAAVPENVAVVLDEAYYEYLSADLRGDSLALLAAHPNLIVTRTFSKAYGLAGLRVGYALCAPDVAGLLNRVRQPFNVSNLAQAAAVAAMEDIPFMEECLAINAAGMIQLTDGLQGLGVEFIPSHGNFVCCRVGDAAAVNRALLERGVIVRPVAGYGMPEHLRVSIGMEKENTLFLKALAEVLGK
ncbi:MAG: histidinol-phosphate transaminase [Parasulfuritortus sp.]|nr:histidinol-phosphate transaminase [Parasulfuritortus sp.]